MGRKILTLDDLYTFYSSKGKNAHFSAKDDEVIAVSLPGNLKFESDEYDPTYGLCPVHLQANHTGENVNLSSINESAANKALPSFANRPILAYIWKDNDGEYHFQTHNRHVNEDGEMEYDEIPVGVIPESNNAKLVYDGEKGKTYVEVDGYLYEEYNKSVQILEQSGECPVSIEINIIDMSYNAKTRIMNINSYYYNGVTILGQFDDGEGNVTEDVQPGMEGSNIKLADFMASNNSMFSSEKVIAMLNELNEKISQLTIHENSKEGGENSDMSKFEELLAEYGKTVEDVDFEYEGMSDEELETAFAEKFAETTGETSASTEEGNEPENDDSSSEAPVAEGETPAEEKFSKTFELSHEDTKYGLYQLLAAYEDADNEWYAIIETYDDYFVYYGLFGGKYYGQKYSREGDEVQFVEERYELHSEFLTDAEYESLLEMRSKYEQYSEDHEKLLKYEAEPAKMEVLESGDYANLDGTEAFEELKKQENHFDLTVEEVKAQCDALLLEYAKGHQVKFSAQEKQVGYKPIATIASPKNAGKYGGIFSRNKN